MRLQRAPRPHRQWLEVGPGKGYQFSNVQSALDSISNAAEDNPFLITVAPGLYDLGGSPIVHNKSHVHVVGAGPRASKLVKSAVGSDTGLGAYNLAVGAAGSPGITSNVTISGLGIYNRIPGGTGTGEPPEPALSIGKTSDTSQAWDEICVENCHIVGNHDGLQIFNYTATRGRCFVRSNLIRSLHDAYTLKTTGQIFSLGNQIFCDDSGLPELAGTGYALDKWKTTGIHFGAAISPTIPIDVLLDKFISVGDSIVVRGSGQSFGPTANQRTCAGVLWYNQAQPVYPAHFSGLSIDLRFSETALSVPTIVAGVALDSNVTAAADGLIVFEGGQIYVDQAGASGTAPTAVACVQVGAGAAGGTRHVRLAGTVLHGRNAQAGGTCYGLRTVHANARINAANCPSLLPNDQFAGSVITLAW